MGSIPSQFSDQVPPDYYLTLNGVRLHYLDWGGPGEPLIFLAGLRFTAHIFIELAPAFIDRFRVLALTRRGHGLSDATAEGNDIGTAANDLHQFLAALHLDRVNLVGHSMGGGEISAFAECYPERVLRLVYLDGSFDWPDYPRDSPNPVPPPTPPTEFPSYDAYVAFWRATYPALTKVWGAAFETMLPTTLRFQTDGSVTEKLTDEHAASFYRSISAFRPNYQRIHMPALGIFALIEQQRDVPETATNEVREQATHYWQQLIVWQHRSIERFRTEAAKGTVLELPDATHFCFIDCKDEVVQAMRQFLLNQADVDQHSM
jgi:pimeloyl-ACP methyl ester carboxylesterase